MVEAGRTTDTRVVTCDDKPEIRRSLRTAIGLLAGFVIVGEAWDVESCGHAVNELAPHLLILDVNIPGGGVAAADLVRRTNSSTQIIGYSGRHEPHIRQAMMSAGAVEFVVKTGRIRPLMDAILRTRGVPAMV